MRRAGKPDAPLLFPHSDNVLQFGAITGFQSNTNSKRRAMPAGRPTKYKPEFCSLVIEVGTYGGWISEMAEACDVHRSSFDEWASVHPEFSAAFNRAKQKAQSWFEVQGREGLTAERFNSALWQKQMSARHRNEYTERRELTGAEGGAIEVSAVSPREKLGAFLGAKSGGQTGGTAKE